MTARQVVNDSLVNSNFIYVTPDISSAETNGSSQLVREVRDDVLLPGPVHGLTTVDAPTVHELPSVIEPSQLVQAEDGSQYLSTANGVLIPITISSDSNPVVGGDEMLELTDNKLSFLSVPNVPPTSATGYTETVLQLPVSSHVTSQTNTQLAQLAPVQVAPVQTQLRQTELAPVQAAEAADKSLLIRPLAPQQKSISSGQETLVRLVTEPPTNKPTLQRILIDPPSSNSLLLLNPKPPAPAAPPRQVRVQSAGPSPLKKALLTSTTPQLITSSAQHVTYTQQQTAHVSGRRPTLILSQTVGGEAVSLPRPAAVSGAVTSRAAPLGSSENPIRIIQQGDEYTAVQHNLQPEHVQQIIQVVHQQQQVQNSSSPAQSIIYNPDTNTRIVYKVVNQPKTLQQPTTTESAPAKKKGRKRKDTCERVETAAKVKVTEVINAKTRSGRLSKPPRHMIEDYSRLPLNAWHRDDDLESTTDSQTQPDTPTSTQSGGEPELGGRRIEYSSSMRPKLFSCAVCGRSYIGQAGLNRHYMREPTHNEQRPLNVPRPSSAASSIASDATGASCSGSSNGLTGSLSDPMSPRSLSGVSPNSTDSRRSLDSSQLDSGWEHRRGLINEIFRTCSRHEIAEMVLPRVARQFTTYDFLVCRKTGSNALPKQPVIAQILREFETCSRQLQQLCNSHLRPAPHSNPPSGPPTPHTPSSQPQLDTAPSPSAVTSAVAGLASSMSTSTPASPRNQKPRIKITNEALAGCLGLEPIPYEIVRNSVETPSKRLSARAHKSPRVKHDPPYSPADSLHSAPNSDKLKPVDLDTRGLVRELSSDRSDSRPDLSGSRVDLRSDLSGSRLDLRSDLSSSGVDQSKDGSELHDGGGEDECQHTGQPGGSSQSRLHTGQPGGSPLSSQHTGQPGGSSQSRLHIERAEQRTGSEQSDASELHSAIEASRERLIEQAGVSFSNLLDPILKDDTKSDDENKANPEDFLQKPARLSTGTDDPQARELHADGTLGSGFTLHSLFDDAKDEQTSQLPKQVVPEWSPSSTSDQKYTPFTDNFDITQVLSKSTSGCTEQVGSCSEQVGSCSEQVGSCSDQGSCSAGLAADQGCSSALEQAGSSTGLVSDAGDEATWPMEFLNTVLPGQSISHSSSTGIDT